MGNAKKGLAIPVWLKTLRSVFVRKSLIICANPDTLLRKRTKLISKCHHRNKLLLANLKK